LLTILVALILLLLNLTSSVLPVVSHALADECSRGSLRGNILSSGDQVQLSINGRAGRCRSPVVKDAKSAVGPFYTYEVVCNPDSPQGPRTLCSVALCVDSNQSFALRNIVFPDGHVEPSGQGCIDPNRDSVVPGVTISQVYAAIRSIKLPGGKIRAVPAARGLANLESFFWIEGVSQTPVELSIAGSVLHARFRVLEYRWTFGGKEPLVTQGPGTPGLESEVNTTFPRRGFYRVGVTVVWAAEAFLDGRRVGEVDDLVSRAQTTYPVAELRTVLTG
jgi:prepilin-type processing-associated H-X9-DG protein